MLNSIVCSLICGVLLQWPFLHRKKRNTSFPIESNTVFICMGKGKKIKPSSTAWKAVVLPRNYTQKKGYNETSLACGGTFLIKLLGFPICQCKDLPHISSILLSAFHFYFSFLFTFNSLKALISSQSLFLYSHFSLTLHPRT